MTEVIGSFDLTLAIAKPRQKFDREHRVEPDLGRQTQCLIGILSPLSRKTNNHTGGNGAVPL
jgi:hypothetical protein